MNLDTVYEQLKGMAAMLGIRAQSDDEKRLAQMLILLILMYYQGKRTEDELRVAFLAALHRAYLGAFPGGTLTGTLQHQLHQMADDERNAQSGYLDGFIRDIQHGKLSQKQIEARAAQYAGSLGKFKQAVKLVEDGEKRLRWVINPALENCEDCIALSGTVKKASVWFAGNLFPKSGMTRCGQNCGCQFKAVA